MFNMKKVWRKLTFKKKKKKEVISIFYIDSEYLYKLCMLCKNGILKGTTEIVLS